MEALTGAYWVSFWKKWFAWAEKLVEDPKYNMDRKDDQLQSVYTSSSCGQQKWGGWTEKGQLFFKQLRKENQEARTFRHVLKVEQHILEELRKLEKYYEDDADPSYQPPTKKKKMTQGFDSDHEDSDGEGIYSVGTDNEDGLSEGSDGDY